MKYRAALRWVPLALVGTVLPGCGGEGDGSGSSPEEVTDCRLLGECDVAPQLDRTVATTLYESAQFLWTGDDPLQKGVEDGAIERSHIAVARGKVLDAYGEPLLGVKISVLGHKEYGSVLSRADGKFEMAVNGGERLVFVYQLADHLTAQRAAEPRWQRYVKLPTVLLIEKSSHKTHVSVDSGDDQVASGETVEDDFGKRQPLVLFEAGTTATATLADGTEQELDECTVHVTEYPLDASGNAPKASPGSTTEGELSYSLEFSVDEADKLGAKTVTFNKPVTVFVENFLELEAGSELPFRYYDRKAGNWDDGEPVLALEIVSEEDGVAAIDVDGDGKADDSDALSAYGITDSELAALAKHYEPGQSILRAHAEHFSAWETSVLLKAPSTAKAPQIAIPAARPIATPTKQGDAIIETQAVAKTIPLAGTPYSLHYQTDRTTAYQPAFQFELPLTTGTVPTGLVAVKSTVSVAGVDFTFEKAAAKNLKHVVTWDGRDKFGRLTQGQQIAKVKIEYVYPGTPDPTKGAVKTDPKVKLYAGLTQEFEVPMGVWDANGYDLGGVSIDVLNSYDPANNTLHFGDGHDKRSENIGLVVRHRAVGLDIGTPDGVTTAADGSAIISDDEQGRLLRIGLDDKITVIAGSGAKGDAGDLSLSQPQGVALAKDGSVFYADFQFNQVVAIRPNGDVEVIVGPEGSGARVVKDVPDLDGIAFGPNGELYIVNGATVLKLSGSKLTTFAGGGTLKTDGVKATEALLKKLSSVAVAPDGSVFVSEVDGHTVRKVSTDGTIKIVAGTGTLGFSGDGATATLAKLSSPHGLAVAPDGSLYIVDTGNARVRLLTPDGLIQTVVGGGKETADGQLPTSAQLDTPDGIALASDGSLFISGEKGLVHIAHAIPKLADGASIVPSIDGRTLYKFDARGKHLETIDAVTGITQLAFAYDKKGKLSTITDVNGLITKIERDKNGKISDVLAPFGQKTLLALDDNGYLSTVTDPLSRVTTYTYDEEKKILTGSRDAKDNETKYDYDANNRLISVTDPTGYKSTFGRTDIVGGFKVGVTSPSGAMRQYAVTSAPGNALNISYIDENGQETKSTDTIQKQTLYSPAGTKLFMARVADPFFGSQVLYTGTIQITTPAGKVLEVAPQTMRQGTTIENALALTEWDDLLDVNGRFYESNYTRKDRVLTTISPMGRTTKTTYDEKGRPVSSSKAGAPTVKWTYDEFGRPTKNTETADSKTRTVTLAYGTDGLLSSGTNPLSQTTSFARDLGGRVTKITHPDKGATSYSFDGNDNVLSLTPPGKKAHSFKYTADDFLETYTPPTVSAKIAGITGYTYGKDLELTSMKQADGRTISFTYDAAKRLKSTKLAAATISYTYDPVGRPSAINRSDSAKVDIKYDGPRTTSMAWSGAITGSVKATYDNNFWLSSLSVNGSSSASFTYDDDGLVLSATSNGQTYSITRKADSGLPTATSLGKVTTAQSFSNFGELSKVSATSNAASVFSQTLTRDVMGRVSHVVETVNGVAHDTSYNYDTLGRLTDVDADGVLTTYKYDSNGNRTSVIVDGTTTAKATFDAQDRILTHGQFTYTQTATGDLQERTDGNVALDFTYDELGNLMSADLFDGTATTKIDYVVDGAGRRIARKVNDKFDRSWVYQDDLRPVGEVAAGVFTQYVYTTPGQGGAPDFMMRSGVPYRFVKDHLGSVRLVINATTGAVMQELRYDAFGRVLTDTNPGFQPFGFAGGLYDWDTKLVRFGARDYDPGMGRWTSKDPRGFGGKQTNLFAYADCDPVNRIDPGGLDWLDSWPEFFGGLAVGGGFLAMDLGLVSNPVGWGIVTVGTIVIVYDQFTGTASVMDPVDKAKKDLEPFFARDKRMIREMDELKQLQCDQEHYSYCDE